MRTLSFVLGLAVFCLGSGITAENAHPQSSQQANAGKASPALATKIGDSYGKLPISFEANRGQTNSSVKFLARGRGYGLYLTGQEAVLALHAPQAAKTGSGAERRDPAHLPPVGKSDVVRMQMLGANSSAQPLGVDALPGTANYFIGNDASNWHAGVPTYSKVRFSAVYPGVDLVYYGNQNQLEYDFVVAPHADPSSIRLHFAGARTLSLTPGGDLSVAARNGEIDFHKPVIYQIKDGQRQTIEGRFTLLAAHNVAFSLGSFDNSRPLIIDPVLVYSTYLGGSGQYGGDQANAIAVDAAGNAYVGGITASTDFPVTIGAFQTTNTVAQTAFVSKLNPAGTALLYSTYIGGAPSSTYLSALAVDSSGSVYLTGYATGFSFPVTQGAFQPTNHSSYNAAVNAFVTKLDPTGSALLYSTYLGGSVFDEAAGIALDASGNAYVAGITASKDFPVTSGAFQTTNKAAAYQTTNAFVTKLNPTGSALVYSSYLGGTVSSSNAEDGATALAVDGSGNAYLAGYAGSTDFPVTSGALQTTNRAAGNVSTNAFVTKLNPAGTALVYSTYLGGSGGPISSGTGDQATGLALDSSGDAYIAGWTYSADFPVTAGALQTTKQDGGANSAAQTAFVAKLNPAGGSLVYCTFLGGTYNDTANGLAVDQSGYAYVTGHAQSSNFPVTSGALQIANHNPSFQGTAFVSMLEPTGSALAYSTYLGGSGLYGDLGYGLAVDSLGNAYVVGQTFSTDFPVIAGAFQTTNRAAANESNAFVAKLSLSGAVIKTASTTALSSSANPQTSGQSVTFTATVTGSGSTTVPSGNVDFTVDGVSAGNVPLNSSATASYATSSLAVGAHTILASYAGDANFNASSGSLTETITQPQTITFGAAPAVVVGGTGTLSATASSGLAVTFTSTTASICTVSGSTVTGVAAGSCVVAANQAGNTNYNAAPQVTQTIPVTAAVQTITFGAAPAVTVGGTGTLSATASSGLAVTFTSTTTSICTVSGSTVTGMTAGSCVVAANQAGNSTYTAAPQVTQTITVGKGSQTITFGTAPAVAVGGTGTVSATASSGLAVIFISTTTSICTVSGSTVTGVVAGSCVVAANQAGNTTYNAAPQVTQTIPVTAAAQTITFGAAPALTVGGTGTLSATASSGLAVTFTSTTTSICTVSGSTVTGVAAGSCVVAANQAGNATYNAAPQITQTITITAAKTNQTITFGTAPAVTVGGTGTVSATATSGLAVTFASTTTSICTVSGSTVTGVAAGTCTIAGNQSGNTTYNAAPQVTQSITVTAAKTNQTITFGVAPTVTVGTSGTVTATATSGLAVAFTSTTPTVCTVSGSTVTGVAAGTCTIAGNQSGSTTFNAAPQVTQNITVGRGSQTITFGTAPAVTVGGTGTVSATATSGLAVTFTSTTTSMCTVSGSTVTGVAAGTCTIAANQAGNTNYNAAPQVTQTITLTAAKTNQTIMFGAAPTVKVGTTGTVSATATSGLAVAFTLTTPTVCTVSGSTITGVAPGTCTIAGNQAGNTTYNAAPQVTQNITVGKGSQAITFGTAPAVTVGGTGTVSATTTSGLAVTFTSTTTSICTVSGSTVTGVAAGTCTIAANQAGNTNYNAAPQVTQTIAVSAAKTNQTITFGATPTVKVGTTGTVSATATSGLAVAFTLTTPTVCTVSGSTVTGVAPGTCTIAGNQAGNTTYNAAPQVTQNITVGKGSQAITFGTAPAVTVGGTGTVSATTTSGLAVTFTSTTTSMCTVSGSTVTGVAAGTCTIAANQAGNTNYNAAPQVTQTIAVSAAKTNQTITFGAAPTVRVGTSGTVSATATSGLAVAFTSTTPTVCTVSGSTVTGVAVGTCTIAGNQAGNTTYNVAPQVTQNITVGKGSQTITFGTAPAVTVGGTGTVSATATSGLALTFTSTTTSMCTVSGSTVTGVAAGTCKIAANQAGNTNYNAATQVTQNITVTPPKTNQAITFGAAPALTAGHTGTLGATASSGLAVTFTSTTTSICTVSGSTVTGVAAGSCAVAANQAGNTTYNAAPQVTQTITVGKGSQTITFGTAPAVTVGGTGTVSATASSGLAVTFTSTTTSICTVSGSTVTGVAAGTCTIAANQVGNTNYNAATQVTQNITVTPPKSNQTITFGVTPTVRVGTSGTVSATATSGLAVAFTSTTPTVCTVSGSTVTGVAAGTCTIAGNQSGNTTYNAAPQVTQNITVGKGSQTITLTVPTSITRPATGTAMATVTSGLAVTLASTTSSICTISGTTVTGIAAGTCTIAANQAGNANYNAAAQVTRNITVN